MTLLFIKPHSGDGSRVLGGENGGCRKDLVPTSSAAGRLMSWHMQIKQKLGVFQQAVWLYLK